MNECAILFHGIVSGTEGRNGLGNPIDLEACFKFIKKNLIQDNNFDIFIHSWSKEHEEKINNLYNPKFSLFEDQEMFEFNLSKEDFYNEEITHGFRTISRYESLKKAVNLKKQHEAINNFKYKWVFVLRFDLVILNKINFNNLDNNYFYICQEPHWDDIHKLCMVHDIIFLSNSEIIDSFSEISNDINNGRFHDMVGSAHILAYNKLKEILPSPQYINYFCKRYDDVEIYRFAMNPDLNELGKQYGNQNTYKKILADLENM